MIRVRVIDWATNFAAIYRPLSQAQSGAWEEFLRANVSSLDDQEIDEAVATLCDDWRHERHPNVKNIFWQIMRDRKAKSTWRDAPRRECEACRDTGWIPIVVNPQYPDGTDHPCACAVGQKRLQGYPKDQRIMLYDVAKRYAPKVIEDAKRKLAEAQEFAKTTTLTEAVQTMTAAQPVDYSEEF